MELTGLNNLSIARRSNNVLILGVVELTGLDSIIEIRDPGKYCLNPWYSGIDWFVNLTTTHLRRESLNPWYNGIDRFGYKSQ